MVRHGLEKNDRLILRVSGMMATAIWLRTPIGSGKRMYYCYLLRCADDTLYTGVTTDLVRRLEEHNDGRGSRYTASRRPVRLVWKEGHADRSSAQKREAEIKRWSRGQKEMLINGKVIGS